MKRPSRYVIGALPTVVLCMAGWTVAVESLSATEVLMKDGRVLRGKLAPIVSLADVPQGGDPNGGGPFQLIVVLDDELRRTFVARRQIVRVSQDTTAEVEEKFNVRQRSLRAGPTVASVGPVLRVTPFDEFGRRIFTFNTPGGPIDVRQGITLITPKWTKVEGASHVWDMRIATSSIPADTLHKILMKQIDVGNVEHHKRIARFYSQSERYSKARKVLEALAEAVPGQPDVAEELAPRIRELRQTGARRLLSEMKLRRQAGQHQMVFEKLKEFPSEDVAGEILQAVREIVQEYETLQRRGHEVVQQFDALLEQIKDTALREKIKPIREEIRAELTVDTLGRMAAFRQNVDDADLLPEEKLSLAISGWLLGSDAAMLKLPVALSVYRVRGLVRQYLAEPIKMNRHRIFGYLQSEEGAVPGLVAGLIAQMKPPMDPPEPISPKQPGFYELEVPGLPEEPPVRYLVQLPPEYNPYRRYPTVVTLRGAGTTATQQIDWWAGAWVEGGWRMGQASRHGYIVIAPDWAAEHQKKYGYSAREHAAVLNTLRDACRRFAVDTDRIFLSGHSMGGDAAWDLGLAHPDLWAGVIPIVARADRYCAHYWENAKRLPFYLVCGELDGDKLPKNAHDLDRYLKRGFNCTVIEYQGRGHEHFYDEILRLFDWMGHFRRDFFPREFTCSTMREWDNYFWWVELEGLPPKSIVDPADWPPPRGTQAMQVTARLLSNNGLTVRTGSTQVSVWLSPEMIDFSRRASIVVNGRRINGREPFIEADLQTLLEDVRTRGDRQHPFWTKLDMPSGRSRAAP